MTTVNGKKEKNEDRPMTKTAFYNAVSDLAGYKREVVADVLESFEQVIRDQIGPGGPGVFVLPGLIKIGKKTKPAVEAGVRPHPFKKGEMMEVKARAARNVITLRPLKKLKEMV